MSNQLYIEVIESRIAGSNDPFEFSVYAADSYGSVMHKGFPSMEELLECYPTRMELLEWILRSPEFFGSFKCKGTVVALDSVTSIDFSGYPEDDSITEVIQEDEVPTPSGG